MAKYGRAASKTVKSAMRRRKRGTLEERLRSESHQPKQAIAIGLSEAREKGAKVPKRRTGGARQGQKRSTSRRTSSR